MNIGELKFLVVEDNDFQRRWLVVMLTNLGAKNIIEATDGLAALDLLQDPLEFIDICFIDLNMPGMDGMELIRHMSKSDNPVSIILASALDPSLVFSVKTMSQAYGVNLLGTIEKPATPENLEVLIKLYVPPHERKIKSGLKSPLFTFEDIMEGLDRDQFEPYFQPKVELSSGKVTGAEAFVRWNHPQYGLISPAAFIPVLEENASVNALTWAVIKKSAAACRSWHEQGFPISVSINLASAPLTEPTFAEQVADCIAAFEIAPEFFTFEITEAATKTDAPIFLENLARLRMKGFVLAVDDYGTGDASMQHHLRIPFSELKIDRSFVVGAAQNQTIGIALGSSLELARKLNRDSTAVGVETREDWDFLVNLGCSHAQGYFIAKPMEGHVLPAWMEEWSQFF